MSSSIKAQSISIADLEQSGPIGAVWVLNTASKSNFREYFPDGGEIRLSIPRINGEGADPLLVKHTWLPTNVAGSYGRPRLLNSMEFRSAVEKELLTIIPEPLARQMLKQEGAAEEQARMRAFDAHVKQVGKPKSIHHANVTIKVDGETPEDDDEDDADHRPRSMNSTKVDAYSPDDLENLGRKKGVSEDPEDAFKASFIMFVDKIKEEPDMHAMNAIKTRAGFTAKEYKHILKQLDNHPKTSKMIQARLDDRKAAKKAKRAA